MRSMDVVIMTTYAMELPILKLDKRHLLFLKYWTNLTELIFTNLSNAEIVNHLLSRSAVVRSAAMILLSAKSFSTNAKNLLTNHDYLIS